MFVLNLISICAIVALVVYITVYFCRYKLIPQSLSITAEYPHQYYYWQCTICTIFGWLAYYFPTVYAFDEYGYWTMLLNGGVSGLALSGYYAYSSGTESSRLLFIHKVGSFSGAVLVSLFYLLFGNWILVCSVMGLGVVLGLIIPGHRYQQPMSNSLVFWLEIGIIIIVSNDLITRFIQSL